MGREGWQRSREASAVQLVPTKTSSLRFISTLPAQEFGSERKISSGKPNIWNKEKCLPCSLTGCSLFYDSAFGFIPCQPPVLQSCLRSFPRQDTSSVPALFLSSIPTPRPAVQLQTVLALWPPEQVQHLLRWPCGEDESHVDSCRAVSPLRSGG